MEAVKGEKVLRAYQEGISFIPDACALWEEICAARLSLAKHTLISAVPPLGVVGEYQKMFMVHGSCIKDWVDWVGPSISK